MDAATACIAWSKANLFLSYWVALICFRRRIPPMSCGTSAERDFSSRCCCGRGKSRRYLIRSDRIRTNVCGCSLTFAIQACAPPAPTAKRGWAIDPPALERIGLCSLLAAFCSPTLCPCAVVICFVATLLLSPLRVYCPSVSRSTPACSSALLCALQKTIRLPAVPYLPGGSAIRPPPLGTGKEWASVRFCPQCPSPDLSGFVRRTRL